MPEKPRHAIGVCQQLPLAGSHSPTLRPWHMRGRAAYWAAHQWALWRSGTMPGMFPAECCFIVIEMCRRRIFWALLVSYQAQLASWKPMGIPGTTWSRSAGSHPKYILFCRGELLMARQEAGFLLHRLCCLPPACLPMLSGQPGSKHPIIALACAQHRSTSCAKAGQEQYLVLTLLWQEQVAISRLSPTEVSAGTVV